MTTPRFHERQRLTQWWVRGVLIGLVVLALWAFVQQVVLGRPFGTNPAPDAAVWVLTPLVVAFAAGLQWLHLDVTVDERSLRVRVFPFVRREIPLARVRGAEATAYRPIRDYWGWGVRYAPGRGWCYTMSGDRGVRIELDDGKTILVGSRRADELAAALSR